MFLRRTSRTRSDGSRVTYLQLAESFRNADGRPRTRIVAHLGREDQLDVNGLGDLATQLAKLAGLTSATESRVVGCRIVGTVDVARATWDHLGLDALAPAGVVRGVWTLVVAELMGGRDVVDPLAWCRDRARVHEADGLDRRDLRRAAEWLLSADRAEVAGKVAAALTRVGLLVPDEPILRVGVDDVLGDDLLSPLAPLLSQAEAQVPHLHLTARGVPIVAGEGTLLPPHLRDAVVRVCAAPGQPEDAPWVCEVDREVDQVRGRGRFRDVQGNLQVREVSRGDLVVFETRVADRAEADRQREEKVLAAVEADLGAWCAACDHRLRDTCCLETSPRTAKLVRRTPSGRLTVRQSTVRQLRQHYGVAYWATNATWVDVDRLAIGVTSAVDQAGIDAGATLTSVLAALVRRVTELRAERPWSEVRQALDAVVEVELDDGVGGSIQRAPASPDAQRLLARLGVSP